MASGMKMFEDVRPWLQVCCELDDLLAIGRIPYSITEIGFCLGLDYRDIYGIDHNYRQHYEKTLQLLTLWKNKNGSSATLWNLIVCLQKLGDGQLLEEFQTAIQKRYANSLFPSSGPGVEVMDYCMTETAKLYQQQSSKQISTVTFPSHPSDECSDSPSPSPLGYSSFSSAADSLGSGLASLLPSDFAVSHPSSCPKSNDSTCSRKSEYFTPPCSIEDESSSGTDNNHKVDDDMKQAPVEHFEPPQWNRHLLDHNLQEELKHKTQQVLHLREQCHREKSKVCALKKKLAQVSSYACKQRREKEELRCKLDECELKTDTLMMEILLRRGMEWDTGSCLQAQLKLLEQEKTSLQEGLLQLQTNYTQVVQDSRWLRLQQQQEHMRLECQVAELSMENRELQAHNMELERQCAALTSPTSWYPRMRETQGVVFHRRSRRDSGVRRCLSDHDVYLSGVSASMEEQCTETSTHSEQQMKSQCDEQ